MLNCRRLEMQRFQGQTTEVREAIGGYTTVVLASVNGSINQGVELLPKPLLPNGAKDKVAQAGGYVPT